MKILLLLLSLLFASPESRAVSNKFALLSQVAGTATITSTQLLPFNAKRQYLLIQNLGGSGAPDIIVKIDSVQSSSEGIHIVAGGNYEPYLVPIGSVWIRSASSTVAYQTIEGIEQ